MYKHFKFRIFYFLGYIFHYYYLKLGIDFPFESFASSKASALRNAPVLGSSTVAYFSFKSPLLTMSFGFCSPNNELTSYAKSI